MDKGFENHTFQEMWDLYSQYCVQKDGQMISAELKGNVSPSPRHQQSVLDRHVKESRQPERRAINDEWTAIYGQGRFRSFTYQEMWQWYSLHKRLQADPQAGSDHERKMAQEAYCSIRQWLVMKEDDITTKTLKRFRQYILDGEKPQQDTARPAATDTSSKQRFPVRKTPRQDVVPPAATATSSSSRSKGDDSWMDDALLVEALTTFVRQGISQHEPCITPKYFDDDRGQTNIDRSHLRLTSPPDELNNTLGVDFQDQNSTFAEFSIIQSLSAAHTVIRVTGVFSHRLTNLKAFWIKSLSLKLKSYGLAFWTESRPGVFGRDRKTETETLISYRLRKCWN
ncbi:unnamed protein product [Leuciscus chuanchicus]